MTLAVFIAALVFDHIAADDLDPRYYMLSEFANAGGAVGVATTVGLLAWGASLIATGLLGLWTDSVRSDARRWFLVASVMVAAAGLVVASIFRTDAVRGVVPPGALTLSGQLHDLGGGLANVALIAAAWASAIAVHPQYRPFRFAAVLAVAVGLVLGPLAALLDWGEPGLLQRGAVVVGTVWQLWLVFVLDDKALGGTGHSNYQRTSNPADTCHLERNLDSG